jgi:hypothetical protein
MSIHLFQIFRLLVAIESRGHEGLDTMGHVAAMKNNSRYTVIEESGTQRALSQ